jgi:HEAT repeat protein
VSRVPPPQDPRSIDELFAAATDWTEDEGWGAVYAVRALHHRDTREVLERALGLAVSDDARCRAQAADILGQLGAPDRTFPEECFNAVIGLLEHDPDLRVIESAVIALGHLKDPRGLDALVRCAQHENADIRYSVAHGLGGWNDPRAVAGLIRLTTDEVALVRDWATFGLGAIGQADTLEIRDALFNRLNDTDEETCYEAIRGLARCGDLRVAEPLIDWIKADPTDHPYIFPAETLLEIDPESEPLPPEELIERIQALVEASR